MTVSQVPIYKLSKFWKFAQLWVMSCSISMQNFKFKHKEYIYTTKNRRIKSRGSGTTKIFFTSANLH